MQDLRQELNEIHARNQLRGDYQKTLALLRCLKAGKLRLEDFEMTSDGWQLVDAPTAQTDPSVD